MKKGWTCVKIPPLLAGGSIHSLSHPWTSLRAAWLGTGRCQGVSNNPAGLKPPLGSSIPLPPASLDTELWVCSSGTFPVLCTVPVPRAGAGPPCRAPGLHLGSPLSGQCDLMATSFPGPSVKQKPQTLSSSIPLPLSPALPPLPGARHCLAAPWSSRIITAATPKPISKVIRPCSHHISIPWAHPDTSSPPQEQTFLSFLSHSRKDPF